MDYDPDLEDPIAPKTREEWSRICAENIERDHGADGPLYIATRMGQFASEGNLGAINTYLSIAAAYNEMIQARNPDRHRPVGFIPTEPTRPAKPRRS